MMSRSEGAWVICQRSVEAPIQLVRVFESWQSTDEDDLVDGCVPMDGSIQAFCETGREWYERYGGLFTGHSSVESFVIDVFCFDPLRGCWHVAKGDTPQVLWPVSMDDYHELADMERDWCEALARILAEVPRAVRGRTILRVPSELRPQFVRWCRAVVRSGGLDECLIRGTRSFREVVRSCADERAWGGCREESFAGGSRRHESGPRV
ncbi:hypothetical protein [Thermophilibacter mediterraneus]|uniref:hypothetical protein n=1 Tax=Thermophilibacter mediterraneus TaxID=1871031 RepID=UPI00093020BC|nr:hypothetical protein [Thermophilibacter mediterraneus]